MVNSTDFSIRLKKIMEYYNLTSSLFADKIGVQRSSISHLLSGRNKPSLDFVLKVTTIFKEVDIYWLINGKGSFPKKGSHVPSPSPVTPMVSDHIEKKVTSTLFQEHQSSKKNKDIDKIVIFYDDGTFEEYKKS